MTLLAFHGDIAVITLNTPPVNSLNHALRSHIVDQINAAEADPRISGIVLHGSEKAFSAGADVVEMGTPAQYASPILPAVLKKLESCSKPVVAAISGVALGGGLELALACHARVALENSTVGLPEITLGLIPGSGGTQRLTRLIGVEHALEMILTGQTRTAMQLADCGLFDRITTGDLLTAACNLAHELAAGAATSQLARDRQLDKKIVTEAIEEARRSLSTRQRMQPAYNAALCAIAANVLPFDEGLARERELFLELVNSHQAQALRYQFKVERESSKLPPELQAHPRPVSSVTIIGSGTMGTGIAISALDAGLKVTILEQDPAALERGERRINDHYQSRVVAGKLKSSAAAESQSRLSVSLDWQRLRDADLVIEAVFEDIEVKRQVFQKIDQYARPGAVLATNTSYLDVDAIARATCRPQDVLGLHFFSPANLMKLVEVIRGSDTASEVLATGMAVAKTLKKLPVLCGNAFGFIGNRIYNAYRRHAEFMLEDGAWPEDVDNALVNMGFAMGPFAVADLSGLDIAWRMRKAQAIDRDPRERYVDILDQLCEQGRLGRKTGAGYYTYIDGKQVKTTDASVRTIIEQASAARGITRHPLGTAQIQRRALLAMVNEAALLLSEGVAQRSSDIDVVMVQGYGFPRWEGGPVFWARQQDRHQLATDMQNLASIAGHGFKAGNLSVLLD